MDIADLSKEDLAIVVPALKWHLVLLNRLQANYATVRTDDRIERIKELLARIQS